MKAVVRIGSPSLRIVVRSLEVPFLIYILVVVGNWVHAVQFVFYRAFSLIFFFFADFERLLLLALFLTQLWLLHILAILVFNFLNHAQLLTRIFEFSLRFYRKLRISFNQVRMSKTVTVFLFHLLETVEIQLPNKALKF